MPEASHLQVNVRVRNVRWARFTLRLASRTLRVPIIGAPLARFILRACYLRISIRPHQWRWSRVPFERVSGVGAEESERV